MDQTTGNITKVPGPFKQAYFLFRSDLKFALTISALFIISIYPFSTWAEGPLLQDLSIEKWPLYLLAISVAPIVGLITILLFSTILFKAADQSLNVVTAIKHAYKNLFHYITTLVTLGVKVFFGLVLLIIPGFYWLVQGIFAPVIQVVDEKSNGEALKKSAEIVHGNWWRVLGSLVIMVLIFVIPNLVWTAMYEMFIPWLSPHIQDFIHACISSPIFVFVHYYYFFTYSKLVSQNTT